ncbi:MAG TPA: penicillin acylase family protein [Novosphingobium sp.]|nr:penicillin acylase family protein [Novosphingobium sp.]
MGKLTRRTFLRRAALGLLAVLLLVLLFLLTWEPFGALGPGAPPPQRVYSVEVIRDEWGVPHIHGKTDPDVAFGVAWAHAEDDFSTLQDVLAMTRGRFGAIAGEDGAAVDYVYQLFTPRERVAKMYPALPADTRALLDAYASGMNLYATRHPGEIKLGNLFPVNGADIATGFALRLPFFAGIDRTLKLLVDGKDPGADFGPALDGSKLPDYAKGGGDSFDEPSKPLPLPMGEDGAMAGSNAFAVAPRRSGDGTTRLISNSHQPWRGGVAWYELEISSDSGWHFAGATFPGSPYPFLGHNETLGWTNTVNRPDLADVYKLVLDADGSHYRLDGKWLPLTRKRVWLPVRIGPLVLPIPRMVAFSAHGPVIENARGAFAIRYAGIDTLDSLTEYYRLSKATNFAEWQSALAMAGVPATNFIYADKAGNIAMVYNARFPERQAGPDWRHVLPGDRSDLIWQTTADWALVPKNINPASGFLFNSNNTPFVAAGQGSELDPAETSPQLGVELDMTNRARRAVRLMSAAPVLDRAMLERIKYDTGYERAGYVAWELDAIAKLDLRKEPELARAQALLAQWDMTADGRGPADALAVMVLKDAMGASYNHRAPIDPHKNLADTVAHLTKYFGRIDPPLGDVIRLRQGKVDLPMDGGGDTLRAATTWNIDPGDGRLLIKHGDSFLMFIEWPKDGPVTSQSIQPFGAATTRPQSQHYADQAPIFVRHGLKPVHFTRADVLAHAVRRSVVTNR